MPRMRGRLYSSCASSTWSLPSALLACWAKMSRISCVRSTTRVGERVLELPLLRRGQLVVDEQRLRARVPERARELDELALADVGPLVGPRALLHDLRHRLDAGRPGQLAELAQLLVGIDVRAQHGDDESPLRLRARSRVRLVLSHD